jgi:hypothetical protein
MFRTFILSGLCLGCPAHAFAGEACTPGFLPTICMSVDITGEKTIKGETQTTVGANSCADWASGKSMGGRAELAFKGEFTPVSGTAFAIEGQVEDFKGPDSYKAESLAGWGTPFYVIVDGMHFEPGSDEAGPSAELQIAADGSGALTFTDMAADTSAPPPHKKISGKATWTCVDPAG